MAKLILHGNVADVEILTDPEDEELVLARCIGSGHHDPAASFCGWSDQFDTTGDAIWSGESHADHGRC